MGNRANLQMDMAMMSGMMMCMCRMFVCLNNRK